MQVRHAQVRRVVVAWQRSILGAKVGQAHCRVESRWSMVRGERKTYEKCLINIKSPILTAMDPRTGTRLVSGCERRKLYEAGTAVGARLCVLATTAHELGDPYMNGRRAWAQRGASLVHPGISVSEGDWRWRNGGEAKTRGRGVACDDKETERLGQAGVRSASRSQDCSVPRPQGVPTLQKRSTICPRKELFGFCRRCRRPIDTAVLLMLFSFSRIVGDVEGRIK